MQIGVSTSPVALKCSVCSSQRGKRGLFLVGEGLWGSYSWPSAVSEVQQWPTPSAFSFAHAGLRECKWPLVPGLTWTEGPPGAAGSPVVELPPTPAPGWAWAPKQQATERGKLLSSEYPSHKHCVWRKINWPFPVASSPHLFWEKAPPSWAWRRSAVKSLPRWVFVGTCLSQKQSFKVLVRTF